jgi:serine/threonine-protein kinase SRPK3
MNKQLFLAKPNDTNTITRWRWSRDRYFAIKINAADRPGDRSAKNELELSRIITNANRRHHGWHFVRHLADSFTLQGPHAEHICLVFEPLREPLWIVKSRFKGDVIPSPILKIVLQMVLHALDYLHSECRIIHTGNQHHFELRRSVRALTFNICRSQA